jgi:hypothetical protein
VMGISPEMIGDSAAGCKAATVRAVTARSSWANAGHRLDYLPCTLWPHQAGDLVTVVQENQRRPKLYPERATEPPTWAIFHLDVTEFGESLEGFGNMRLRSPAMTAPVGAELDHACALDALQLFKWRALVRVVGCEGQNRSSGATEARSGAPGEWIATGLLEPHETDMRHSLCLVLLIKVRGGEKVRYQPSLVKIHLGMGVGGAK